GAAGNAVARRQTKYRRHVAGGGVLPTAIAADDVGRRDDGGSEGAIAHGAVAASDEQVINIPRANAVVGQEATLAFVTAHADAAVRQHEIIAPTQHRIVVRGDHDWLLELLDQAAVDHRR